MKKKFYQIALIMVFSLLFTSCSPSDTQPLSPAATTALTLVVEVNASPALMSGAEHFCTVVSELSEGLISTNIIYSADPAAELSQNSGQLYFMSNDSARSLVPALVTLELPYLFPNEKQANDFLSSKDMLKFFNTNLASDTAHCIGGSVTGGRYFINQAYNTSPTIVSFHYPYYNTAALVSLKLGTNTFSNWDTPLMDLSFRSYEMPLWYLAQYSPTMLTVNTLPHSYDIMWILSDKVLDEKLTQAEQNIIAEAAVRTCGFTLQTSLDYDKSYLQQLAPNHIQPPEQDLFLELKDLDIPYNPKLSNLNKTLLDYASLYSD
ncbi:MAG: hypothetical protein RR205_01080 [Oscillospiraceae bacterium]